MKRIILIFSIITGRNEVVTKVLFLLVSVILSTGRGGCLPQGDPPAKETPQGDPPAKETPQKEALPGGRPPWKEASSQETPWKETPHKEAPLERSHPPGRRHPPPPGIWSMSGRYASYWNVFLLHKFFSVGRSASFGIFLLQFKVYFLVLISTYKLF